MPWRTVVDTLDDARERELTGLHLRRLRERRAISRTAAAMALGWNYRRLRGIEQGHRTVRYAEVIALLELYESRWSEFRALGTEGEER